MPDEQIIQEYRTIFQKYAKDVIVDIDKRSKHQSGFCIYPLEQLTKVPDSIISPYKQTRYAITYKKKAEGIKSIAILLSHSGIIYY